MNGDMAQTAADIDLLQDIRFSRITPSVLSQFSLDGDGDVDTYDIEYLVETLFNARIGDINLDGSVDTADYTIWADHYGATGVNASWSTGDLNGDRSVDSADYTVFADHYLPDYNTSLNLVDSVAEFNTLFGIPS